VARAEKVKPQSLSFKWVTAHGPQVRGGPSL
jgi:hypothetical protein